MQSVQFPAGDETKFYQTLRSRVDNYFKTNNVSKFGGMKMVSKTIAMLLIYFVPYGLIISSLTSNIWLLLLLVVVMGIGLAGIGLSIMHDANHGAYSKDRKWNKAIGYVLNVVGGNSITWRIQHNVLRIHSQTLKVMMKISIQLECCVFHPMLNCVKFIVFNTYMLGCFMV